MNKKGIMASALTLALVLAPLTGLSLGVSAEEGEPAAVRSVSGNETGVTQLSAPTDLSWGSNYELQFTGSNESGSPYWGVEVYKDGESYSNMSYWGYGSYLYGEHSLNYSRDIDESGTYKFRVRALADDDTYADSEWSEWSEERTYVRPARELGTTVAYWDTEKWGEINYESVENASGYYIVLASESYYTERGGGISYDAPRDIGGQQIHATFAYDISNLGGPGKYYITIRALSNNIDEIANGPMGPKSDILDTTANAESLSSILESSADKSAAEAKDTLTDSADISAVQMAMQTDDTFRGQIQALEEKYAAEQNITVKEPAVSAQAKQYVDPGRVQVVGAGLNAAAGSSVGLELDVTPEANRVSTYTGYSKNVQLDIKLVSDGQELHDLTIPVSVTMPVPQGFNAKQLVILHYHEDGTVERTGFHDNGDGTITFTLAGFSTFVFAEETAASTTENKPSTGNNSAAGSGSRTNSASTLESQIAAAAPGSVVKVTKEQNINALPNSTMQMLVKRGDVALEMEYTYEGTDYHILIPAGLAVDDDTAWYGPLYLSAYYSWNGAAAADMSGNTASVYMVQRGDTLSKIARANNTTVARLAAKNPQIKNINRIMPGQIIEIE